jgi:hypothetical protein
MKKVLVLLAATMLFAGSAFAFTLSWGPVTSYTDNSLIGSEANGVFYNVEMDSAAVATRTPAVQWILTPVAKRSAHTFRVQTVLGTGELSAWSPLYSWTAPAGNPNAPGQLKTQ